MKYIGILTVLLLGLIPAADSQTTVLDYGESSMGRLDADNRSQQWQFHGRAGEVVFIDMLVEPNQRLDPILELYAPSGMRMGTDDDSGSSTNARLGPLALPEDGTYTIITGRYSGEGPYIVTLNSQQSMSPLRLKKPLQLALTRTDPIVYLRYTSPGDAPLRLQALRADGVGVSSLMVYTMNGERIASRPYNDAGVIDPLLVQAGTQYIIAVEHQFVDETQPFTVSLGPTQAKILELPAHLEASLNGDLAVYYFFGHAEQTLSLTVTRTSGTLSPSVYVRSGDAFVFSSTGSTTDSVTATFALPTDGLYTIEISDGAYSTQGGQFQLTLNSIE